MVAICMSLRLLIVFRHSYTIVYSLASVHKFVHVSVATSYKESQYSITIELYLLTMESTKLSRRYETKYIEHNLLRSLFS